MNPNLNLDRVFQEPISRIGDFVFDEQVAVVFDDMLARSIPLYAEVQRMVGELATEFAVEGTNIYDLGCSTGTTLLLLHKRLPKSIRFVGVDYSEDMLVRCGEKLARQGCERPHELRRADLNQGISMENASLALMILTLQFIRPLHREKLLADILRGLNDNGCLLLLEKVLGEDSLFNRLFIEFYYDFKRRNGYSELEIAQKRDALENVLIPYKLLENRELLQKTGFRYVDVFFKWYNFCGIIAVK